jgi:hypothetical protein
VLFCHFLHRVAAAAEAILTAILRPPLLDQPGISARLPLLPGRRHVVLGTTHPASAPSRPAHQQRAEVPSRPGASRPRGRVWRSRSRTGTSHYSPPGYRADCSSWQAATVAESPRSTFAFAAWEAAFAARELPESAWPSPARRQLPVRRRMGFRRSERR